MKFCLLFLVLMWTVCGSPACPSNCESANKSPHYHHPHFLHDSSRLRKTSVAPWVLTKNVEEGREPETIRYATCKDCTVEHMIAKPIYIQISVYQRIRNNTGIAWCKCPYDLAVGCTCVNKQQQ